MTYSKFFICETLDSFNSNLESGLIGKGSLVFIQDTKQIWTHEVFYSCPYSSEEIEELFAASEGKLTELINELKATATTTSDGLMSAQDKTRLDELVDVGGEPNQNAYSKVKVGDVFINASMKSDTLEIAGEGDVVITPDATSKKLTVAVKSYEAATSSKLGLVTIGTSVAAPNGIASAGSTEGGKAASVDHVHPLQENVSGNAGTATKLGTARNIELSGAVNGAVSFDGSEDVTISTTLSNIDASKITSGVIDIERLPKGALERLIVVANDEARFSLTTDDVQLGDTVKVESTNLMYYVTDVVNLDDESGYKVYTAGSASSVPWSGVTDKPSVFTPDVHTHVVSDITDLTTASSDSDGLMSAQDKVKLDEIGGVLTSTKTLVVSNSWTDTGILTSQLDGTGTYVVQINLNNSSESGAYNGYWSGIMSAYDGVTDDTTEDEIFLHCSSQSNGAQVFLRTVRQKSGITKLQIASNVNIESASYVFKFRKLI